MCVDQVYADPLFRSFTGKESFDELLAAFRRIYVKTWTTAPLRQVLRNGVNWMIPDDHDFTNNADSWMLTSHLAQLLLAGKRAFQEYQLQLRVDLFDPATGQLLPGADDSSPAGFSRVVGNTALLFVDTRVQRTYHFEPEAPLFGRRQFHDIQTSVATWGRDPAIDHIFVLSPTPFFINPESSAHLVYFMEKEVLTSHPQVSNDTDQFLQTLLPFRDKVLILGGDIHAYLNTSLCHLSSSAAEPSSASDYHHPCLSQISTSGISNGSAVINSLKLTLFTATWTFFTTNKIRGWAYTHHDAYLAENFVELSIEGPARSVRLVHGELTTIQRVVMFFFTYSVELCGVSLALTTIIILKKLLAK